MALAEYLLGLTIQIERVPRGDTIATDCASSIMTYRVFPDIGFDFEYTSSSGRTG